MAGWPATTSNSSNDLKHSDRTARVHTLHSVLMFWLRHWFGGFDSYLQSTFLIKAQCRERERGNLVCSAVHFSAPWLHASPHLLLRPVSCPWPLINGMKRYNQYFLQMFRIISLISIIIYTFQRLPVVWRHDLIMNYFQCLGLIRALDSDLKLDALERHFLPQKHQRFTTITWWLW